MCASLQARGLPDMDRWPLNVKADAFVVITLREANGNVVQECKSDQVGERE